MSDYKELKRLAEEHCISSDLGMFEDHQLCENILDLIAENERLAFEPAKHSRRLIDQLKSENERLKSENDEPEWHLMMTRLEDQNVQLKAENEALRKDAERLEGAVHAMADLAASSEKGPAERQSLVLIQQIAEKAYEHREGRLRALERASVAEQERDQLRAELAGLRTGFDAQNEAIARLKKECKGAELYRQVERGAHELPEGWEVRICIEKDSGYVELFDEDGCEIDFPNSCETLWLTVSEAIDAAMGKGGES
ncbi:hypothetical protein SAMN03159476_00355 [Pseudomonas sp. NFPP05]|uniref:hypothetical protein n=1 Tax=unclassified Pseudomonas TaxID=196821 RepID=UPI000891006B|nr:MULTISPECIES: hypothetical protein [unclassified Pseudomonas]SDA11007.1 hypothetical protein SAMN03159465_00355 [Pseudomonas sp. NFPP12]SFM11706.1 hypothetical protein SAMN03159476_00355 [Pseudomonas sp. NFPP05]